MTKKKFYMLLNMVENPRIETEEYLAAEWNRLSEFCIRLVCSIPEQNIAAVSRLLGANYHVQSPITVAVVTTKGNNYEQRKNTAVAKWRRWLHQYNTSE